MIHSSLNSFWRPARLTVLLAGLMLVGLSLHGTPASQAACAANPDAGQGTDTMTVNIPSTGTYRIWSRLLAPDTANNSYYLQIDNGCAYDVGDSASLPANTWSWVGYQNGSTTSAITMNLTAGTHQVLLIGREAGVGVDRLLFLSDANCTPTGNGDNCASAASAPASGGSGSTTASGCTTVLGASGDLQAAINNLRGGDTLCLPAGTTYTADEFDFRQTTGGTAAAPITVTSQDHSNPATIDGRIVLFANNNHITLSWLNLHATRYTAAAPTLTNGGDYNSFLYDDITNNHTSICESDIDSGGIYGVAHYTTIDHNRIHDCGILPSDNGDHGIYESGFNATITNNYIYGNVDRGIQLRGANNAVVEHNIVDNNGEGIIFGDLDTGNNKVDHNIFSNSNIRFNAESILSASSADSGNTFSDNCLWSTVGGYYGSNQSIQPGLQNVAVSNATFADPQYANQQTHDYRLAAGSPCLAQAPQGDGIIGGTSDTTKPSVSFSGPANNATVSGIVTATAAASDNVGVAKVEFYVDGSSTPAMTDTSSPYNYSFDTKTLSNGTHALRAEAYDAAGNSLSATINIMVNNADTTAPSVPTGLVASASNATTVRLTWSASTDSGANPSGVVRYNVLRNGAVIAQPTATSYTDTNAVANTSYNYAVQAVDSAGNASASSKTASVTTPAAADTTPPSVPANPKASVAGPLQINVTWAASTDSGGSGLTGYNVYRNGSKLNTSPVTGTSYGDTGLTGNATYTYKVEAVDGAGNKSAQSAAASATIPGLLKGDVTGPNGVPDGTINIQDISFVIRSYNTATTAADVTGPNGVPDGKVDLYDLSYEIRNYGQ